MSTAKKTVWYKVLENKNEISEGRITTVTAGTKQVALSHFEGKICALDNSCPHQGGPLGEGSIENGILRCPWHGWDYHPCTGKAPGFDDGVEPYEIKEEADGTVYVGILEEQQHQPTISDVMLETMVNWGVNTVFGMVGHSNLGLADAMHRLEEQGKLQYFGIRHEGAAAFAASGYAKLTGKPAACFGIAGPGSTNMFTGMWDAKVDRVPLLALSGQVNTQVVGTGAFQEVDLVKAFQTVAGYNHAVHQHSKHTELMTGAIKHALVQRDVSHLSFPDEVQALPKPDDEQADNPTGRITPFTISPPKEMLDSAISLLKKSKRPVIIVGHGARHSMDEIIKMAEMMNSPVITTFKGKGLIPDSHPLACGVLGRSGTPIASWFMNESDLLVVFGASFSNHTGITPKKPIIQVDFDPMALSKFHKVDVALWGEIGVTCRLMQQALAKSTNTIDQRPEVANRWKIWKTEKQNRLFDDRGNGISSIAVFDAMNRITPENAVIAVDVGNNTYSFGRYFECKNQSVLMSGYLGSIGYALPAAMGAWAAVKNTRPVWSLSGDGGLGQYLAEITTLVKYNMPVKHILINNSELGKISKEQRTAEYRVWQTDMHNPDFAAFANNCGALGIRVEKREQLIPAMQKISKHNGPALLEVICDVNLI